ncbi:hypothetical protein [Pseudomonas frederiksbergensis]|uniref:Uncharacterized protein n=1 Tax=Pseudomonas frederiksbergensis TaxID=104087 RepID=A0A423K7G1_9PSED|nr:hypothetical protein [Pseudomonas frederiksbergensis]RON47691.1 hypothetical protein BK665_25405 [Pseudomonas frederiksbergensis]
MSDLPLDPSLPISEPEPFAAADGGPIPRTVCLQPGESVVVEVDPGIGTRLRITAQEKGNALPGNGFLATSSGPGSVTAEAAATSLGVVQRILGTAFPQSLVISPDGTRVYVAGTHYAYRYGALAVIDTATNEVIRTLTLGVEVSGIAVSADSRRVYVARCVDEALNFDIAILDSASLNIIGTIPVAGIGSSRLALSPDGAFLYACGNTSPFAGFPNGRLAVIDIARGQVVQAIVLQNNSKSVAISPDGRRVYASNSNGTGNGPSGSGTVSVLDTRTLAVLKDIEVGVNPDGTVVSLDGTRVYTVNFFYKTLIVMDAATLTVIRQVPIGIGAFFLALSPDGKYLCASNAIPGNGAAIIDTSTFSLSYLPDTAEGTGVAFSADGARVYICNWAGNSVWVVDR